jgi:hypothetical protein
MGTVDGRSFEAVEADAAAEATAPGDRAFATTWQSHGDFGDEAIFDDEADAVPAPAAVGAYQSPTSDDDATNDPDATEDDRGPLLKFLSSVKP